ncbi:glycosyltransferase [Parasphingorhabdus pacifica]
MRILFSALPTHGHCYPLLPLAVAARRAGNEVVFATGPAFHSTLIAAGLEPATAGMSMPEAVEEMRGANGELSRDDFSVAEWQRQVMSRVFGDVLPRRFVRDLIPVLDDARFDLVVHEAGNPGAGLAAMRAGVPGVCHGFGREDISSVGPLLLESLHSLGSEMGLPLPSPLSSSLGNPYLDIYPASLRGPESGTAPNRIPLRPVPFDEGGKLPGVVTARDRGRPLVYLTLGTAFANAELLRTAIEGLAAVDGDLMVAAGPRVEASELWDVPDNVTVLPWVPQAELLPHADLVVHHGGSGTTLGALGAAVPQLFLPQGADQFINADAAVAAGAGTQLFPADATPDSINAAARALLAGTATASARRIADEIAAMPSPEEVATRLPEFTRG